MLLYTLSVSVIPSDPLHPLCYGSLLVLLYVRSVTVRPNVTVTSSVTVQLQWFYTPSLYCTPLVLLYISGVYCAP